MEGKLIALKLFLDTLEIDSSIDTVADRKRVQKAVYLGQLSGVDLGYRFSWYVMGPYSSPLTRDYYQLSDELETEDDPLNGKSLLPDAIARLTIIRPLLQKRTDVDLSEEDWLELLASYHFLRSVSGYSPEKTAELLRERKSHVADYIDRAIESLSAAELLNMANAA